MKGPGTRVAVTLRFHPRDIQVMEAVLKANGRKGQLKEELRHIILNLFQAAIEEGKKRNESSARAGDVKANIPANEQLEAVDSTTLADTESPVADS